MAKKDKKHMHKVTWRRVRANIVAMEEQYSECVFVGLGIQHAMCMSRNVICGFPGSQYFSTLSHKWQDF